MKNQSLEKNIRRTNEITRKRVVTRKNLSNYKRFGVVQRKTTVIVSNLEVVSCNTLSHHSPNSAN